MIFVENICGVMIFVENKCWVNKFMPPPHKLKRGLSRDARKTETYTFSIYPPADFDHPSLSHHTHPLAPPRRRQSISLPAGRRPPRAPSPSCQRDTMTGPKHMRSAQAEIQIGGEIAATMHACGNTQTLLFRAREKLIHNHNVRTVARSAWDRKFRCFC